MGLNQPKPVRSPQEQCAESIFEHEFEELLRRASESLNKNKIHLVKPHPAHNHASPQNLLPGRYRLGTEERDN
ncbi:MAG TPA: hypothetical protein VN661_05200 [Candidatus Acidoferrales bacterium]|nr:hypothetical protein [Candidatus Acidoferrales bacterium]